MAPWLHIEESAPARAPGPQWQAFLSLGFRPLYPAGCAWAAVSVALWVFAPQWLVGSLAGVAWHAHEMLWGFVATIAVGFLLTAGATWTGVNPLHGPALAGLCLLWLLARAAYLVPGGAAFAFGAACELLFFSWAALALGRAIHRARNRRNAGLPLLVAVLGVADAAYLRAAWQGDHAALMQHFGTGLLCMALIALLVARRILPFFSMRALPGLVLPMLTRSGQVQLGAAGLALVAGWLDLPPLRAAGLAAAGTIALYQCAAWKPWATRRIPLLWILHAGYAGLAAGLLLAAWQALDPSLRAAWPIHAIGVAGFSVLIIGMVTRTALGHLGRPLRTDRAMATAYALILAAAALRLAALLPGALSLAALHASATAWILAFALYLWRFFPMLIRPRADAR